jgi:hypothetical protein
MQFAVNIGLTIRCDGVISNQIAQEELHPSRQGGQPISQVSGYGRTVRRVSENGL